MSVCIINRMESEYLDILCFVLMISFSEFDIKCSLDLFVDVIICVKYVNFYVV